MRDHVFTYRAVNPGASDGIKEEKPLRVVNTRLSFTMFKSTGRLSQWSDRDGQGAGLGLPVGLDGLNLASLSSQGAPTAHCGDFPAVELGHWGQIFSGTFLILDLDYATIEEVKLHGERLYLVTNQNVK